MTDANLASGASADTTFPRLADIMGCSREKLAEQTFDGTTSPRLGSRLARRPKGHFPYALQPFCIVPPAPGDDCGISVSEANRRLQQTQALSERQQHFGQLIDLASTGECPRGWLHQPNCQGLGSQQEGSCKRQISTSVSVLSCSL